MKQVVIQDITDENLKGLVQDLSAKRVFLVTGKNSYESTGAKSLVESGLEAVKFFRFSDFEVNPKIEDVKRGALRFKEHSCDLILAIGGGSVIDMAKSINVFQAHEKSDYTELVLNNDILNKGVPFVAIPTTSGTGSEATHFAVIYLNKKKYSLAHKYILPDIVGLNYKLTFSQPEYLTACAGLDALSQAIESYWSVGSTTESREYAQEAVKLLIEYLSRSVLSGEPEARKMISRASFLAGKAINISKTTAAHALSYAFTTYYSIPHGHAVFLTLPQFLEYNYHVSTTDLNDNRGTKFVRGNIDRLCKIMGVRTPAEGSEFLKELAQKINIELSPSALGIVNFHDRIIQNVNMERMGNNPRRVTSAALCNILGK